MIILIKSAKMSLAAFPWLKKAKAKAEPSQNHDIYGLIIGTESLTTGPRHSSFSNNDANWDNLIQFHELLTNNHSF
jgi:hypothetical protein